jgi:hypothetical protein
MTAFEVTFSCCSLRTAQVFFFRPKQPLLPFDEALQEWISTHRHSGPVMVKKTCFQPKIDRICSFCSEFQFAYAANLSNLEVAPSADDAGTSASSDSVSGLTRLIAWIISRIRSTLISFEFVPRFTATNAELTLNPIAVLGCSHFRSPVDFSQCASRAAGYSGQRIGSRCCLRQAFKRPKVQLTHPWIRNDWLEENEKEPNRRETQEKKRSERSIATGIDSHCIRRRAQCAEHRRAHAIDDSFRLAQAPAPHDMFLSFATVASRFVSKSEFAVLVAFHRDWAAARARFDRSLKLDSQG